MVKVRLHPPVAGMSGKMGIYTYRRMYGKQTMMKTPDMSKVKWSEAQKANRESIAYARAAMADPTVRAHYEKVGKQAGLTCGGLRFLCGEETAEKTLNL